jgi:transposase-like protein
MRNPFRCFNSSPEVIRLTVMMYVRYPLSLRQVEDLLFERGIDICHETVRLWWNRFGPMFAAAIRKRRVHHRSYSSWRWHLDEVFVKINGETHYLWRAVDHEEAWLRVLRSCAWPRSLNRRAAQQAPCLTRVQRKASCAKNPHVTHLALAGAIRNARGTARIRSNGTATRSRRQPQRAELNPQAGLERQEHEPKCSRGG